MDKPKSDKSKFLRVSCPRCKHQQIIFGKSTMLIKCERCNYLLLKTKGGKAQVRAAVKRIL